MDTMAARLWPLLLTLTVGVAIGLSKMHSVSATPQDIHFPAEWENHTRTVMVWPSSRAVWDKLLEPVQADIASIARAIAKYEPVTMLVNPNLVPAATKILGPGIDVLSVESDDLWARDTLPVFVKSRDGVLGVDLHFNGWGRKQRHSKDAKVTAAVIAAWNLTGVNAPFIGEGGALETDGQGTLLITESSIVNDNRNPNRSRDELEQDLKRVLGISKVIWVKGVKGGDITDAHIDALARFASPGVVVLSRPFKGTTDIKGKSDSDDDSEEEKDVWAVSSEQAMEVLKSATDARGNRIRVVEIYEPDPSKISSPLASDDDFLSSYLNYYVINGAVIVPRFGDATADRTAQDTLRQLYPGRDIVAVAIDTLAGGGGGIHCATHEMLS